MRYSFGVFYTPEKHLLAADVLCRAPHQQEASTFDFEADVELLVNQITEIVPIGPQKLSQSKLEQEKDSTCKMLTTCAL